MAQRTGRKRVERSAALVALWLALGVIVNLAVAWICVLRAPRVGEGMGVSKKWVRETPPPPYPGWESQMETLYQALVFGVNTRHRVTTHTHPHMERFERVQTVSVALSSGWPYRSFAGAAEFSGDIGGMGMEITPSDWSIWRKGLAPPAALRRPFDSRMAVTFPRIMGDPHRLPLRPLWPGVAVNTIVYATLLWIIWMLLGAARARLRAKPGACRACGYTLTGLAEKGITTCPECGAVDGEPVTQPRV